MDTASPGRWIIIGNGRCGSTLLSDLIAEEPATLSVQEFFMAVAPWARSEEVITGVEYWSVLSSPKAELSTLVRVGLPPKELRYPRNGRWAHDLENLPRILAITLPKITDRPDELFDLVSSRVRAFPLQSVGQHHRMFLDLLTTLTGRRRWVERSGGSSHVAPYLLRSFPDAKIVYLSRNYEDTARSMSRHPSFQLIQLRVEFLGRCGLDPFRIQPGQEVPEDLEPLLPDRLTAEVLSKRSEDMRKYLALCVFLTNQAEQALADVPPRHLLRMTYEDLVADPGAELGRLGRFLEFEDWAGWADAMAQRVVAPARPAAPVPA